MGWEVGMILDIAWFSYEQMLAMSQNRVMNYEDLLEVMTAIVQAHHKSFHHPILAPLKSTFKLVLDWPVTCLMWL